MDIPAKLIEDIGISRGVILHSTMFKTIDHGKFFVVIGVSKDKVAGFFFINSNINRHLEAKQEQLAMQYMLRCCDYDFLKHDSFVSAIEIKQIPCKRIAVSVKDGESTIIDHLRKEHLDELLEAARNSRLFSKKEKQMFLY